MRFQHLILFFVALSFSQDSFAEEGEAEDAGEESEEETEDEDFLLLDPDEALDFDSNQGDGLELEDEFGENRDISIIGEGEDTAELYREFQSQIERLGEAEEAIEWQEYLEQYPNSLYRSRIEKRIEELEDSLYGERFESRYTEKVDAENAELYFAQPLFLENIDPRHKLHAGFEMGLPSHLNLLLDYEHQIKRNLSAHVGTRQRYTGYNIELGAKYAIIKSSRTQSLVTVLGDLHFNSNPFFPAFRPQVAGGKSFNLPNDIKLDAMAQVGTDVILFKGVDPRLIGGFHLALIPNPTIRFFVESQVYMKDFAWENGAFAFNTVTFGLKFFDRETEKADRYEAGVGATVPYYYHYWRQHYGAIAGDLNLYLDE